MKINFLRLFSVAFIISGCNKNINHHIDDLSKINFTVINQTLKSSGTFYKSSTFFPYGFKSVIYIHKHDSGEMFTGGTPVTATSFGTPDLVTEKDIVLPQGYYDVFSISDNTTEKPQIEFSGHYASGLKNGTDYLWAKNSIILPENSTVNLEFNHIASRIIFYIYPANINATLLLTRFFFTPPETANNVLYLNTGTITPSQSADPLTEIAGSGNSREIIVLPCSTSVSFEFEATIFKEGEAPLSKRFSGTLPMQLRPGISYEVLIEIKEDFKTRLKWSSTAWSEIDNQIIFSLLNN